jgi:stage II sporulation protein R
MKKLGKLFTSRKGGGEEMRKLRVLCFILGIVSLGLFLSIRNRENTYNEIASKVLRLHVIGNSDSIQDQRLKMEVKKDIEDYLKKNMPDVKDAKEAESYLIEEGEKLKEIGERRIRGRGYEYVITMETREMFFPKKNYEKYEFPAGNYRAVRFVIGEGKGKNWWGILYPNLCLTEGSYEVIEEEQDEKLKAILSEEEYRTILSAKTEDTQVSFRCMEIIQEWLSR